MTTQFKLRTEKTAILTNYGEAKDSLILVHVDDGEAASMGTDNVDELAEMLWDERRFFQLTVEANEQIYMWMKQGRGTASVTIAGS